MGFCGSATHRWPPDEWTHSPWLFRSGPKTSKRGFKRRSQPSLDAKEQFCKNTCLMYCWKIDIFEGRVAKLPKEHPPFCRPQAATASHRDGRMIMLSLGNTLLEALGFFLEASWSLFIAFSRFVECVKRFAGFGRERRMSQRFCTSRRSFFGIFLDFVAPLS